MTAMNPLLYNNDDDEKRPPSLINPLLETNSSSDEDEPAKRQKVEIAKQWLFTDDDASTERQAIWKATTESTIKRLAFQLNKNPSTGKVHLQGCFELYTRASASTLLQGALYQRQRVTNVQAINLALNSDTRSVGTTPFIHRFKAPTKAKLPTTVEEPAKTSLNSRMIQWIKTMELQLEAMLSTEMPLTSEYQTQMQLVINKDVTTLRQLMTFYRNCCEDNAEANRS